MKFVTDIQKKAALSMERLSIFDLLKEYSPVLAGTIPLNINIKDSDLDIICEVKDLDLFEKKLRSHFGHFEKFKTYYVEVRGVHSLVCEFFAYGFQYEVFAQNVKTSEQYAVVHMNIEKRILDILGETAVSAIRELKISGLKTEPAFCKYLNINGDPFDALYELSKLSESELKYYLNNL